MKDVSSDIEFDAPTQVQMCSSISQGLQSQISHLQKTYTKNQFTTIIKELADTDPLYYCDKQSLQLIYDKTVQYQGELNGTLLADFAMALKDKNKEKFHKEIALYKEYIQQAKTRKLSTINSKELLNYLYEKDQMGYLTDCVYELLNQQENVSIKKLQDLIDQIQFKFNQNSRLSVPKKLSLKKSSYYEKGEQFEEMLFDVVDRESVDIESFRKLKDQILMHLDDPIVSVNVEKEMNRLEDVLLEINQRKIPSLKEEVINLTTLNQKLTQQLGNIYEELDAKSTQLYQAKSKLMQLTQQNRKINKQLINKKIQLNERQQIICQLSTENNKIHHQLQQQKQSTKQFFLQYQNLQQDYNSFLQKITLQQEKQKAQTQLNFFPSLSLKQQLQDAKFKIKRLKDQQVKLKTQLQNNQTAYIARIQFLQQELQQAKNYANKAENLKASGLSRLSKNFQFIRQSNYSKKSIFDSVASILTQSNKPNPQNSKMSIFLDQVQDFMKQSKTDKLIKSKHQLQKAQSTSNQQIQGMLQIDKQINIQYLRQSKANDLKYNFCDVSMGQIRKQLQDESPSILSQDKSEQKIPEKDSPQSQKTQQENTFLSFVQIISKDGSRFKKYLMFNRKGVFMFDTKLRLQKEMKFTMVSKITFTYYNLDCFVISFKRKESPMKKRIVNHDSDIIFKCLRAKELVTFLSQPLFKHKVLKTNRVRILIEKQQNIWIRESTQKEIVLSNCGTFYNPFRLNLSLKNHLNNFFYAQLSRQNFFSRNYIIICIVQESGVYCFEWTEDEMEKEKRFIYLLPFVKRMLFVREIGSVIVKLVYEDWSDGKTFLLRFKNNRESLKFETVCKERLNNNLKIIETRKKLIQSTFVDENNLLDESVENSFQKQLAHEESH